LGIIEGEIGYQHRTKTVPQAQLNNKPTGVVKTMLRLLEARNSTSVASSQTVFTVRTPVLLTDTKLER